jgi:zinc transport system ATP-binding protein
MSSVQATPVASASATALVEARGVRVGARGRTILDQVDVTIGRGELVTLVGPNGSGKTTLVRALLGLIRPDQGSVWRAPDMAIGYVPQDFQVDASLPLTVRRFLRLFGKGRADRIEALLAEVGIAYAIDAAVHELSGGELRRVLMARALLRDPDLLVLDEPMAGVDVTGQAELYELIRRIRDVRGCGVLVVSHDLHLVMATTDRVYCLNGHICCSGAPEMVSRDPAFLALFGPEIAGELALYTHRHQHRHALSGDRLDLDETPDETPDEAAGDSGDG